MKKLAKLLLVGAFGLTMAGCSSKNEESSHSKENKEVAIYLIRHGKTFFNTTDQVQGFSDSPLTEKGISQAEKLGQGLKDITFDLAYSSDLSRQRNTAKLILSQNANKTPEIYEHEGFKEWNYGGYEGKSNAEMWDPIFAANGLKMDEDWSDYGKLVEKIGDKGIADAIAANDPLHAAETYEEIVSRGQSAMDKVIQDAKKANAKNVMIVSSGSMIPTLLEIVVPDQYQGESIENCSVTILKYKNDHYSIDVIGDTQYVK